MRVLVTGSDGFIGKNLCVALSTLSDVTVLKYDRDNEESDLLQYTKNCDFVFHLAGVNRPDDLSQFAQNYSFTSLLIECLKQNNNSAPILFASSIQAQNQNPYGQSKREAERLLFEYGEQSGSKVFVYRLGNVFGKWCRPRYNSVVATFCDAAANGRILPVNDPDAVVRLVYIDDVVAEFVRVMNARDTISSGIYAVHPTEAVTVGYLACCIAGFSDARANHAAPDMGNPLIKKLYSTYLSYLPADRLALPLTVHEDGRGAFAELLRIKDGGQVSVNRIAPGAEKGGHYHHTKIERFVAISGRGEVVLTPLTGGSDVLIPIDASHLAAVDIPPGYLHRVINTGDVDLVMVMWANEWFDSDHPDTYRPEA